MSENIAKETNKSMGNGFFKEAITFIIAILIGFLLISIFRMAIVRGKSMDNTLFDGQHLILFSKAYTFKEPERGEIVVASVENLDGENIIKRVIGTPGDHLVIEDNHVYINDELLVEDYLPEPMDTEDLDIIIPEGKVFLMGDNRNYSGDSRSEIIGLIDIKDEVLGKIIVRFPF